MTRVQKCSGSTNARIPRMKKLILIAVNVAVAVYMCASNSSPCPDIPHSNGKDIVEISGILNKEAHWGPPNFGENPTTDSQFTAWILHLDYPFKVVQDFPKGSGKELNIEDIQLVILGDVLSDKQIIAMEKKHLVVQGRLWTATTAGDVTDVNIEVATVTIEKKIVRLSCVK